MIARPPASLTWYWGAIVLLMALRTELGREQWKFLIDRYVGRAGVLRYTEDCVSAL